VMFKTSKDPREIRTEEHQRRIILPINAPSDAIRSNLRLYLGVLLEMVRVRGGQKVFCPVVLVGWFKLAIGFIYLYCFSFRFSFCFVHSGVTEN
jgi:hypothetical protein